MKQLRTICNRDCPDTCSIVATVEDGRVTALRGDPEHPVTRGFLCYRTQLFLERQYAPDRLTTPLVRRQKGGALEPIGWDDALDVAAGRLARIKAESGPAAIFHYRSGGNLGVVGFVLDRLFQAFGPVTVKRGDICSGAGDAAQGLDFGEEDSNDLFDLENARSILLWGKNVYTSSPHTAAVLRDARAKGARIVLVDPVHHKTAGLCERFVQPRPGADFDLAMGVARILFDEGWTDPDASSYCDHLDELAALARSRTVAEWCARADVTVEEALDLARRLGRERPSAILVGWGMARRANGGAVVRALDALSAISGNLGVAGGGVSYYFKRRRAFDARRLLLDVRPPRTVCEPLFGQQVLAAKDPPIRAVWITAGNPVTMLPESQVTARALESRDFVVVVDSFLTDTARRADLVLPTTTLLETDDLQAAYGHHWIGVARPVVPPPDGVRSDLEIAQGLAGRLGLADVVAGDARTWQERILAPALEAHGVDLSRLERGAVRNPIVPEVLFADRKFPTATGRVNLVHEAPLERPRDPAFPLLLLALSTDASQSSQWARPIDGPLPATLHPDAAQGLPDGATCRIESALGAMPVRLRHDRRQRRDVVIVPKGGHLAHDQCANAIIRAALTDLGEGGALYDEPVRVVPS